MTNDRTTITSIHISKGLRDRLKQVGSMVDTYETLIDRLIREKEKAQKG
jgi:hypothetical protein